MRHLSPALLALGWTATRADQLTQTGSPHRVIRHDRGGWTIAGEHGELLADLRGRLRRELTDDQLPRVGDWVLATARPDEQRASIEAVLPRSSALIRKAAGTTSEPQVVAANVDIVFVIVPADAPPNPRRVERELALVWESGASPVIVVTKADLDHDHEWVRDAAPGVDMVMVDSISGDGVDGLGSWLTHGSTIVLLGPSGAGKSTLANALLGDDQFATGAVRDDDLRGRHTTTHRELVALPSGALLIDTPGVRELGLFDAPDALTAVFDDVEQVAADCRFSNCTHAQEPGCAVRSAVEDGALDPDRLASWRKLQRELAFQARRTDARLAAEERKRWAAISKEASKRARR
jgi:ribosome biogenesis GTPase / thiamine phosphate phosphatase